MHVQSAAGWKRKPVGTGKWLSPTGAETWLLFSACQCTDRCSQFLQPPALASASSKQMVLVLWQWDTTAWPACSEMRAPTALRSFFSDYMFFQIHTDQKKDKIKINTLCFSPRWSIEHQLSRVTLNQKCFTPDKEINTMLMNSCIHST